jgi:pimeloyl-ACP methyl ester carboxylesterase
MTGIREDDSGSGEPIIVLVHGAWADASSWGPVVARLQHDGYDVFAIANPLRSLESDAMSVRAFLESVKGPIVRSATHMAEP